MSEFSPIFAAKNIREINADIENKKTINEVGEQSATKLQERPTAEEERRGARLGGNGLFRASRVGECVALQPSFRRAGLPTLPAMAECFPLPPP